MSGKMKYLKLYESYNEVVVKEGYPLIIGYQNDIDSRNVGLDNGYYTGTILIGSNESEDKGMTDYSSPFHTGQVTGDELDDDDFGVEEMDFTYNRGISTDIVRQKLDEIVARDYNGKITKMILH